MKRLQIRVSPALFAFSLLFSIACGGGGGGGSDAGGADGGGDDGGTAGPRCTDLLRPLCEDAMFLELNLQTTISPGLITNVDDGAGGFNSHIDATAGGFMASPPQAYVYARFEDTGLLKVEVSDDDALASLDWDIAFRRYVIRLNSGVSGPSCVDVAEMPVTVRYGDLDAVPAAVTWSAEAFYDNSCTLVDDGSGLPSSPGTALSSYYEYTGCVAMTNLVYLLNLRDGRVVKVQVESYYAPDKQAGCDTTGVSPTPPTGSGNLRIHWAFVP